MSNIYSSLRKLRPIIGKQRDKDPVKCDFEINNHKVSDPSDIANAFSDYFAKWESNYKVVFKARKSHLNIILRSEKQKLSFYTQQQKMK